MNAAKAGAIAALVWAAVEPFDQRMMRHDYSDVAVLGKAVTRSRAWPLAGPGHARGERRGVWTRICAGAEARHVCGDHGARRAHRPLSARRHRRSPAPRARDERSRAAVVEACVRASDLPAPALRRAARASRGLTLGCASVLTPDGGTSWKRGALPAQPVSASAPATTSRISCVISAWRARLRESVRLSINSPAFFEACRIAGISASRKAAADSIATRWSTV